MEHFVELTKLQIATGKCAPTKLMPVMCCICTCLCECVSVAQTNGIT